MTIASYKPSEIRKFIVGVVGALTILVVEVLDQFAEFIPANVAGWLTVGVGFATAVGVYLTKNAAVIDSLDGGLVGRTAEQIKSQLDDIARAIEDGKNIRVKVERPSTEFDGNIGSSGD